MNLTNLNRLRSKNVQRKILRYKCFHRNPYINAEIVAAKKSREAKFALYKSKKR